MEDLDKIFEEVNGHGKFQRIFLYVVVGPIFAALAIATNSELLILNQNDHWCYHPMTEGLNETELVKWKNCYLFFECGMRGADRYTGRCNSRVIDSLIHFGCCNFCCVCSRSPHRQPNIQDNSSAIEGCQKSYW